jgi:hypothetical protein
MPIPASVGGQEWVPTCLNCHDLKDRTDAVHWSMEAWVRAFAGISEPMTRILLVQLVGAVHREHARVAELERELQEVGAAA